ncbi:hypothetical protein Tco_0896586 [Tanacetum coccineum]
MITEEMKHTEHYKMFVEVFGLDVPLTQSKPTESTQGTHRTPSVPRSPNPKMDAAESSAPKRSTMICFCLPDRRSTRLTPPAPVPTVDKADEMILQDTLQMLEGPENVIDDSSIPRNDESNILGTRLEPRSDKESPEVEIIKDKEVDPTNDEEVEITNVIIPVNVNDEEEEITDELLRWRISGETPAVDITNVIIPVNVTDEDEEITDEVYELKRREKGKNVEETRNSPIPTPIRSPRIHTNLVSSDTEKLQELTDTPHTTSSSSLPHKKLTKTNRLLSLFKTKPTRFKRYKSFFHELQGRYGYLFAHLRARFMPRKSFDTLADNLHDVMVETLPTIVDKHVKKQVMQQVPEQERGNIQAQILTQFENAPMSFLLKTPAIRPRDQDDPHDDAYPEGENSTKRQKTSEYEAYVSGESSSRQVFQEEQAPSTLGNQEQDDDFDFWTDSYASDDDEIPMKQVSQDIIEEVSLTIDEAKLRNMANEMLRQRCTSGDEHQYHIDQMKNFLKSDIVWESRKEILVSPHARKTTPLVHSCQKDPEAPALSLINQDLLYLKIGNSVPEKIVLSLQKFPVIIFNDDDIEERTSRWVNKSVKKFNPYARYGVEH